jgi:hypothetical protein
VTRALPTSRLALIAGLLLRAAQASADEEPNQGPPPDIPQSEPEKRQAPDYDGRGGPRDTPARKALWVPRVLLFPAYVVSEYLVRRPLGFAITAAEKSGLPSAVYDFLDLGSSHPLGVVPFVLIDFGFEPSVGLYAYWDNAGFEGHELRLRASTWGPSWLSATATERFRLGDLELALTGTATRRPDYTFYGIGPDTREQDLVRYSGDTVYARFESRLAFKGRSALETSIGYRGASYGHSDYDTDDRDTEHYQPSLDDAVAAGELAEPAGFRSGFRAPFGQVRLLLDSRGRSQGRNGARVDLLVEQSVDLKSTEASGWRRYSGTLWGFLDLLDGGRMLSLSVTGIVVDPLGAGAVPFTQLASLGGGRTMPGLRTGRLYDRSALVTNIRYAWPIWLALNGSLQAGVGNVFGAHFDGFRPERTRLSLAIGLETGGSRDSVFQALVGFGTETLESGADLDTIRAVVGVRNGF